MTTSSLSADARELLAVLKDLAIGADVMLQPIPLLSSNKPLVRYAEEVKRVAQAAIKQTEAAPHSWEIEELEAESTSLAGEAEMDEYGISPGMFA